MNIREFYTQKAKEYGFDGFADFLRKTMIDVQMPKIYEWTKEYTNLANDANTGHDKCHIQRVSNPVCRICDTPYSFDKKKHIYTRECDC